MEKWLIPTTTWGLLKDALRDKFGVHEYEGEEISKGHSCFTFSGESIKEEEEEVESKEEEEWKKRVS